ncbi:MAG: zinc ribbon domain-containing protein [Acidobacteria bacterium]|nr:zinc ribbon domain-containing protein [Acidobacteriota bacterium]
MKNHLFRNTIIGYFIALVIVWLTMGYTYSQGGLITSPNDRHFLPFLMLLIAAAFALLMVFGIIGFLGYLYQQAERQPERIVFWTRGRLNVLLFAYFMVLAGLGGSMVFFLGFSFHEFMVALPVTALILLNLVGLVGAIGYVYGDAKRRGMNPTLWTLVVIFVPNFIGFIVYFLVREPVKGSCPGCGRAVAAQAAFCPHCGHALKRHCPTCKIPLEEDHEFCPGCGRKVSERLTLQEKAE